MAEDAREVQSWREVEDARMCCYSMLTKDEEATDVRKLTHFDLWFLPLLSAGLVLPCDFDDDLFGEKVPASMATFQSCSFATRCFPNARYLTLVHHQSTGV